MDVRYEIFISSTFEDLKDERRELIEATIHLKNIPVVMELFSAADESQWEFIKKRIDACDYYVIILSDRYGSVDKDGIGYVEKEYDYAVSVGKPVIGFMRDQAAIDHLRTDHREQENKEKLSAFKKKVSQKLYKRWSNKDELVKFYYSSIIELINNKPQGGWVRKGSLNSEQLQQEYIVALQRENKLKEQKEKLETIINELRNEIVRLESLDSSAQIIAANLTNEQFVLPGIKEGSVASFFLSVADLLIIPDNFNIIIKNIMDIFGGSYMHESQLRKLVGILARFGLIEIKYHRHSVGLTASNDVGFGETDRLIITTLPVFRYVIDCLKKDGIEPYKREFPATSLPTQTRAGY